MHELCIIWMFNRWSVYRETAHPRHCVIGVVTFLTFLVIALSTKDLQK